MNEIYKSRLNQIIIFSKIISDKIPAYKILENDNKRR